MNETTLTGRKLTGKRRRPKTVDGYRTCTAKECSAVLSRYNRKDTCSIHTPVKFPRVRGHDVRTAEV